MIDRMISARTELLLEHPFWGSLALGLKLQEDPTCPTAWVDGRSLGFNPQWIARLTKKELIALIAHEVMHCCQGHMWRRDNREMFKWNIATDAAINDLLRDSKNSDGTPCFTLPKGAVYAQGPEIGQSAEWIYARLPDPPPQQSGGQGQGEGNSQGEVRDAPTAGDKGADGDDEVPTEAEWQQATKQAALSAKAQGKLPANLERFANQVAQPRVDWKSTLRRFVQERSKADYIWTKPSPRYMALGLYLPVLESHELGHVAIAVDTSGSIDSVALAAAKAEVTAVLEECKPAATVIYYADAAVARADRFDRGEPLVWRPKGGGGTDFRPVFKACEDAEEKPVCLIYISDLAGRMPEETSVPTIWVTDTKGVVAPIGETICMS
jgi:predicted metal-dependent peptidase